MNNIKYIWGEKTEPYIGDKEYKRVKVYYTKNGSDQWAVYMDYGQDEPNYKLIEDNAYRGNRLTEKQGLAIGAMLNNKGLIVKGE